MRRINPIPPVKVSKCTLMTLSFSDLHDHRFNNNINCESPIFLCGIEDETSVHFFLHCLPFSAQRAILLSTMIILSDVSAYTIPVEIFELPGVNRAVLGGPRIFPTFKILSYDYDHQSVLSHLRLFLNNVFYTFLKQAKR